MSKPVLGYWDIRGLAEPIRLMFEYAGAEYDDKRYICQSTPPYDRSDWTKVKPHLGLDFPNLPYLIDGDVKVTESWAVMLYVARKYNLEPAKGQEHLCDMLQGVVQDFRMSFVALCYTDYDTRKDAYFAEISNKLDLVEAYIAKHKWIGGEKLSYVDFALCEILNQMTLANPSLLNSHKKLEGYLTKFDHLDKINAYRNSKRFKRFPCNNPQAKWGGTAE